MSFEVLNKLLELGKGKTEHCRFNPEQYHSNQPKASKPQQHSAIEALKSEEVEGGQVTGGCVCGCV